MLTEPLDPKDIPLLPRYISVAQAARIFGMSKPGIYDKIYKQRKFDVVFRVGDDEYGDRPFLLLLKDEVLAVKKHEDEIAAMPPPLTALVSAWNQRVKDWGRQSDMDGFRVNPKGPPNARLVEAYLNSNPRDPRPR